MLNLAEFMNDLPDTEPDMVPPGVHEVVLSSLELVAAESSGIDMYKLKLVPTDEENEYLPVYGNLPFPDEARAPKANVFLAKQLRGFFQTVGHDFTSKGEPRSVKDLAELQGSIFDVTVEMSKPKPESGYEPKPQANWIKSGAAAMKAASAGTKTRAKA